MKNILIIILLFPIVCFSQINNNITNTKDTIAKTFDFTMYLIGNAMKDEAVTLMQNIDLQNNDSINFLKGYTFYSSKLLNEACENFDKVSENSPLFTEANFLSAISNAHLYKLDEAKNNINKITEQKENIETLKNFELAGISLLKRNFKSFDYYITKIDTNTPTINIETKELLSLKNKIFTYKNKSLWLAASLSALIPGLGKVYAGNIGEGISTFLITGSFITLTAENWYKKGPTNWKTILFGAISTVFYIGNIYGSAITVKVNYENFNKRTNVQILYNIHIPLRNNFHR